MASFTGSISRIDADIETDGTGGDTETTRIYLDFSGSDLSHHLQCKITGKHEIEFSFRGKCEQAVLLVALKWIVEELEAVADKSYIDSVERSFRKANRRNR